MSLPGGEAFEKSRRFPSSRIAPTRGPWVSVKVTSLVIGHPPAVEKHNEISGPQPDAHGKRRLIRHNQKGKIWVDTAQIRLHAGAVLYERRMTGRSLIQMI